MLKASTFRLQVARDRVHAAFAENGIDAARVILLPNDPSRADHFARFAEADIALDPFPYSGTTTTCEALWMGLPVISLIGQVHRSRVGYSQLSAIGLSELAASDEDDYVRIAAELAGDLDRLATLRKGMRERMQNSPLMDGKALVANLQTELERIYQLKAAG